MLHTVLYFLKKLYCIVHVLYIDSHTDINIILNRVCLRKRYVVLGFINYICTE